MILYLFLAVFVLISLTAAYSDSNNVNLVLFKRKKNVNGQICRDADSVFDEIQIFSISACLMKCYTNSRCESVFHARSTGDCVGCSASYVFSTEPFGLSTQLFGQEGGFNYYSQQGCPDAWNTFGNSCYFITEEKMNFQDGVEKCQSLNARAVTIDDEEENTYLQTLLRTTMMYTDDDYAFFTGFTDVDTEGIWTAYGTTNQLTFQDWGRGEPNSGTAENCLAYYSEFDLKWVDISCSSQLRIICEIKN